MSQRITKSKIDSAVAQEKDYFLWDSEVKGFGLNASKGGTKSNVLKYRHGSGRRAPTRRMTIAVMVRLGPQIRQGVKLGSF